MPVSPLVVACLGERMVANHDIRHFRAFRFNELNSRLVLTGTEMPQLNPGDSASVRA
jgi:hypothetical protein